MAAGGKTTLELIIAARNRTKKAFAEVGLQMKSLDGIGKKLGASLGKAAKAGALIGAAATVAAIVGAVKAFTDFEDAMANVRKTTGMTKEEIGHLGDAIDEMALRIPVAQTELAGIAAVAGQLGIQGSKNILTFTEDVAMMATAFDMDAKTVATAMAKLSKIYDIPIDKISNLGSAINVLGNTTAASEQQLMAFSMALGPTARQLGFTETEALSLGATLISIGVDGSNAGTRLSRAFTMIGSNLEKVAEFMGVSVDEFTKSFEEMPMETFVGILEKLSQVEGNLKRNTIAAELFNEIGGKAIKGVTGDLEGLRTNLKNSAKGSEENISLMEEFAAKTDTLKANFALLKNTIFSLLTDLGGEIAPVISSLIDGFRGALPVMREVLDDLVTGAGEAFESIGRQAGPALEPLIKAIKEAGKRISTGLDFKTLADDIGVFIGAGLRPLMKAITWLIDKLGPLWDMIGKSADAFHKLANALKTEEGKIDDLIDATNSLTEAKQTLFDLNNEMAKSVNTLGEKLKELGGWTATLTELESNAKMQTDKLAVAQNLAAEAIAKHGAESTIAKKAIENVKNAEVRAKIATEKFHTALNEATTEIVNAGVATNDLEEAHLDFISTSADLVTQEEEVAEKVREVQREMEEAQAGPIDLGKAFADFGKKTIAVFLEVFLQISETVSSIVDTFASGLDKIGFDGLASNFDKASRAIRGNVDKIREALRTDIEDPLKKDIPQASEKMAEAMKKAAGRIADNTTNVKEKIVEVVNAEEEMGKVGEEAGKKTEDALKEVKLEANATAAEIGDLSKSVESLGSEAKNLLDADWGVFSDLEADLPNINRGIKNMESAFSGLHEVLLENIDELEAVKTAVSDIDDIAAPFIEEGFLNGIKSIGNFAGALKDAGTAISTFSDLQDINIHGAMDFSLHVNDMVTSLQILKGQMGSLTPSFAEMDSLINDIAKAFLYGAGKAEKFNNTFTDGMNDAYAIMDSSERSFGDFKEIIDNSLDSKAITYWGRALDRNNQETDRWRTITVDNFYQVERGMQTAGEAANLFYRIGDWSKTTEFFSQSSGVIIDWAKNVYGATLTVEELDNVMGLSAKDQKDWLGNFVSSNEIVDDSFNASISTLETWAKEVFNVSISQAEAFKVLSMSEEEQVVWLDKMMHSEEALTFQMDKQTNALKTQTEQLTKITDALSPYLEFMATLGKISEVVSYSEEDLANGFTAISNTLINLGTVINNVSLEPAIKALFGEGEIGEAVKGFVELMDNSSHSMTLLMTYIERLSTSVSSLKEAFKSLEETEAIEGIEIKIQKSVSGITNSIVNLKSLIPNMFVYGSGLMSSFISGINAWIPTLIAQMQYIAGIIKSYLGVSSPTELGPLREINEWPKNLVRTFSEGIKSEMGTLNASFGGMVVPMEGGGAGGGNHTSIAMHITQNISDKKTADYSVRELERILNKHEVM